MLVNNLGTIIYTFFFGKEVGKDAFGNRYFLSKNNSNKKWVLYKSEKNPTAIPVAWQLWLTKDEHIKAPSAKNSQKKYAWEKNRIKNFTGTLEAYHPAKKIDTDHDIKKKQKYKIWTPD